MASFSLSFLRFCFIFFIVFLGDSPQANPVEFKLSNGLRLIVKEDHRAPTLVHMVWYHAGSMDEKSGTTGVAHVLEHMMFKETKSLKEGEFSRIVSNAGGRDNAFTSRDYTAYFQQVEKSKLPLMMKLEADRMQNLIINEKIFAKEINVVKEERRWRTEDKPQALVYENLVAAAFKAHPYRWPVIGWMSDLESMTWRDAYDWYHHWYAPNNAVVIVIGDIKPQAVLKLAKKYYGPIRAKPLPVRKPQQEPTQEGVRRLVVKAPAKLPYLLIAYKVPRLKNPQQDWEPYALEILESILEGDSTTRLEKALVRGSQIAVDVGASYDATSRGPALFYLDGTPTEGKTAAQLEAAIREELAKLIREGVTVEELDRVKTQVVAAQVYKRDSIFSQALEIGSLETSGLSFKDIDIILEKLKQVTAEQVQAVAKKYFSDDNLTIAVLDPQPLDDKKPSATPKGLRH